MAECPYCDRSVISFIDLGLGNGVCSECHGSGLGTGLDQFVGKLVNEKSLCERCGGSGKCPSCRGKGRVENKDSGDEGYFSTSGPSKNTGTSNSDDDDDGNNIIGKLIGGIIGLAILIWLIFSVIIPLVIINASLITLIAALVAKRWNKILLYISAIAACYTVIDYSAGFSTKTLFDNMSWIGKWLPALFYINIVAGLVSVYFLISVALRDKNPEPENTDVLQNRNFKIMGVLFLAGILVTVLHLSIGSSYLKKAQSIVSQNNAAVPPFVKTDQPVSRDTVRLKHAITSIQKSEGVSTGEAVIKKQSTAEETAFYIISVASFKTAAEAKAKVNSLKNMGNPAAYLWIPDYASLSGAHLYCAYLGPFINRHDCEVATELYRKVHPDSYGVLVSHEAKKEQFTGIGKTSSTQKVDPVSPADNVIKKPDSLIIRQARVLPVETKPATETVINISSPKPIVANIIAGTWNGSAKQKRRSFTIQFICNAERNDFRISYPSLGCSGNWTLERKTETTIEFREHIFSGKLFCQDGGLVKVTMINNRQLQYDYYWKDKDTPASSGVLTK